MTYLTIDPSGISPASPAVMLTAAAVVAIGQALESGITQPSWPSCEKSVVALPYHSRVGQIQEIGLLTINPSQTAIAVTWQWWLHTSPLCTNFWQFLPPLPLQIPLQNKYKNKWIYMFTKIKVFFLGSQPMGWFVVLTKTAMINHLTGWDNC